MIKTGKPIEEKDIVVNTERLSNLGILDNETIKQATQMRKAHLNLAKHCLDKGYSITVHYGDGEGSEDCEYSKDFNKIKECVEACDEAYMNIFNEDKKQIGWAWVIFGNEDNELVSDYSANKFMDEWFDKFQTMYEKTE